MEIYCHKLWKYYYFFCDSVILFLMFLLESILMKFNVHKIGEETNYYKRIINIMPNSIIRIKTLCDEKAKILKLPGVVI